VSEAFESLLAAILQDDSPAARKLLKTDRGLSSGVVEKSSSMKRKLPTDNRKDTVGQQGYVGD
jgi:hypothetical protein